MGEKKKGRKKGSSLKIAGRHFSTGGVVFKKEKGKVLWLVTKSSPSDLFPESVWRLPKGFIDDEGEGFAPGPMARGEKRAKEKDLVKAALKEVEEEGGVKAKIVSKIGTVKYFITVAEEHYLKFVTFFLMEYQKDLPEGFGYETSEISWLPFKKARETLIYEGEKGVLDKAKKAHEKQK